MMISLPTKWIKLKNLKKGDEVEVSESKDNLIISTETKAHTKTTKEEYNLANFHPLINRALISLYIRGADEIELSFSTNAEMKKLKKHVLEQLVGFEIINQTQTKLTIKDITGVENQDADILIKRIFFILDSMAEELIGAIKNKEDLSSVIEIDSSVNKFVNFCLRLLSKKGYKDQDKLKNIYFIVSSLEEIGDLYKEIAKEIQKSKKIDNEIIKSIMSCKELLKTFEKLLFDFNRATAKELANMFEEIQKNTRRKDVNHFNILQISQRIIRMNNELFVMNFN
jgi:phosphate uptake regulator